MSVQFPCRVDTARVWRVLNFFFWRSMNPLEQLKHKDREQHPADHPQNVGPRDETLSKRNEPFCHVAHFIGRALYVAHSSP